jgi:phenylacetate-CoA ligase
VRPEDIRDLSDLPQIPLTSRNDLQDLPAKEIVAQGVDPGSLVAHRTSGSSGMPLTIRRDWLEERLLLAYRLRTQLSQGRRWREPAGVITYIHASDSRPQGGPPKKIFYERLGILPRERIDCLLPADQILARLRDIKPGLLAGTPSVLSWLTGELSELDRKRIRPRLIFTGGETVTDAMRGQISDAFQAPVLDSYGSHEFVNIASECPRTGGYHISDQTLVVEVLRDGKPVGPGEEGELVGTALHSYAMPFVRYRLGDLVILGPSPCPCGAPFSTLLAMQGRTLERIRVPDGRSIHPYAVISPLVESVPWVRRFQIVQNRFDHFQIKLIPTSDLRQEEVAKMRDTVQAKLGSGAQVDVEVVDQISPGKTGKFYPYVSLERLNAWKQASQAG